MRFIIYGAGAIGGVIGARLVEYGFETVLVARGAHLKALQRDGLLLRTPNGDLRQPVTAVGAPADIDFRVGDVVILAMKSQDTAAALDDLRHAAGDDIPVICCQNGVANERMALRRFHNVYGQLVWLPATFLEPGVVLTHLVTKSGVLDVGRYPSGTDAVSGEVAAALTAANFVSESDERVMRWKYAKLLGNLNNAVDALCGRGAETREIARAARDEATACYTAAGIEWASPGEERERRAEHMVMGEIAGEARTGGSTWQSLARGATTVEADYLNGEICQLGRVWGVPTPVNRTLQLLANRAARDGMAAGTMDASELTAAVERANVGQPV
jgi:2-dehydropantoate 2-reductase